jgi:putative ABC transport system permease protein
MILANIIACPLALYYANKWLEGFAYRTEISLWIFIMVILLSSILVLIMIGLQSMKAATANPVKSLKYE